MITLGNKVVMVRFNTDYPENSPKKWRVLVGEVIFDEELKLKDFLKVKRIWLTTLNQFAK